MGLYTAIESLVEKDPIIVDTEEEMYALEAEIATIDAELAEAEAEMAEFEAQQMLGEIGFEMLDAFAETVEQYGICKGFIKLVDPDAKMQELGIIPSIESVSEVPTKDEHAAMALEGIKEVAKKVWEAIKKFFRKIKEFFSKLLFKLTSKFKSIEKLITVLESKLNKIDEIDKDKFEKAKVITYKEDYGKQLTTGLTMKSFETLTKELNDIMKLLNPEEVMEYISGKETDKETLKNAVITGVVAFVDIFANLNLIDGGKKLNKNQIKLENDKEFKKEIELTKLGQFVTRYKKLKLTATTSSISYSFSDSLSKSDIKEETDLKKQMSRSDAISEAKDALKRAKLFLLTTKASKVFVETTEKAYKHVENMERYANKLGDNKEVTVTKLTKINTVIFKATTNLGYDYIKLFDEHINMIVQLVKKIIACAKS